MTVLGEQGRAGRGDKALRRVGRRSQQERSQVYLESIEGVFRVMMGGEGVSRLPSIPQGHFPAFSLAPPSTSVCLGTERRFAKGSWIARAFPRPVASLWVW